MNRQIKHYQERPIGRKELRLCDVCGQPDPLFRHRITVATHTIKIDNVREAAAMDMYFGGASLLSANFSPTDMTECQGVAELIICQTCAAGSEVIMAAVDKYE